MSAQYRYEPLACGEIRVMNIRPGRENDPIQCHLQIHNLHAGPDADYSALSYAWGSTSCPETILIDGCSFPITYNLFSALQHVRDRRKRVSIWADAVCINQGDNDERACQVLQMRLIYHSAARVIIWLGESDEKSDIAMDHLRYGLREGYWWPKQCVLELFCRPWWTRIWVVQEAASARHDPIIRCGNQELPWSSLRLCQSKVPFTGWMQLVMEMRASADELPATDELVRKIRAMPHMEMFFGAVERLRSKHSLSWRDAFALGYVMKSTDPRDLTYALIGLLDIQGVLPLVPDYHKDVLTVRIEAAAASLQPSEGLDTLALTASTSRKHLPTWVPDMANGEPGMFLLTGTDLYRAAGQTVHRLSWSDGHKVLHASGMVCDTVLDVIYGHKHKTDRAYRLAKDLAYEFGKSRNLDSSVTKDRFWRTMIANQGRSTYGSPTADLGYPAPEYLGHQYMAWQKEVQVPNEAIGDGEAFDWRTEYITPYFASLHAVCGSERWSFFTTMHGRFGLGQKDVKAGDLVCVLHGGHVTYILRKEHDHYILVGCAYVHGIMDGEISHELSDTTRTQNFNIH